MHNGFCIPVELSIVTESVSMLIGLMHSTLNSTRQLMQRERERGGGGNICTLVHQITLVYVEVVFSLVLK